MIEITLLGFDNAEVVTMKVEPAYIAEAACVVFDGRYFIYGGMEGRFFSKVKFTEVKPPVVLTHLPRS